MQERRSGRASGHRAAVWLMLVPIALALEAEPTLGAADSSPSPLEGWHSPALRLSLLPPAGWSLSPGPSVDSILFAPRRGKGQIALLELPFTEAGTAAEPSLDGVVDAALISLKAKVASFKLLERRPAKVADVPAQEIYFRGKVEGEKYRWIQTIFLRGTRQVILMYTAPEATFTQFLGDYDQVVRSVVTLP